MYLFLSHICFKIHQLSYRLDESDHDILVDMFLNIKSYTLNNRYQIQSTSLIFRRTIFIGRMIT